MQKLTSILCLISIIGITACEPKQDSTASKPITANDSQAIEPVVKQSNSGLCHDANSGSFKRTKNFTPYDSMPSCIAAGGKAYKGYQSDFDKAEEEAIEEGRSFVSLYNRNDWPHWIDSDKDCQNTRHELLIATSKKPVKFKTDKDCNVLSGEWFDFYSGETYNDSKDLDLDHVVPLKFAHGHGGDKWSRERKQAFANDLDNLLLVQASLNRQKGAKGLTEWLPPNHSYRCDYIAHFNKVMTKYELDFIPSERRIVNRMVQACEN
ncbi:HNH endonuclease family protein [Glaciecola petra]|uniref:HNH endonuclease family protein n=1 Tax=Glaciecola petra TaxID=3075602 RepID=A0ABU2ZUM6_9ALTE|nr:HNH endonuclease family protein [Aestuariibacter sp. P117]MDT0596106.1 HNH endonuclease family protein [Aestuariibacter sp. P117]